jgi:hypothetical protein
MCLIQRTPFMAYQTQTNYTFEHSEPLSVAVSNRHYDNRHNGTEVSSCEILPSFVFL